jgi:hypothetical protein
MCRNHCHNITAFPVKFFQNMNSIFINIGLIYFPENFPGEMCYIVTMVPVYSFFITTTCYNLLLVVTFFGKKMIKAEVVGSGGCCDCA